MPQISIGKTGGVIRWDGRDWLKGLTPQWSSTSTIYRNITDVEGFAFMQAINVWRNPGYVQPGFVPEAATNNSVVTSLIKNGVANVQDAYMIGGAKIHKANANTASLTNDATFPHSIVGSGAHSGHTGFDGEDIITYNVGATKYVFYSYNDGTDGDVGRYDLSTTFVENYMSGTAASGAVLGINPHPMVVGDDDILYIGDGNVLSAFDGQNGANGTFSASVFTLPKTYVITTFSKIRNFLVIYAYKSNSGGRSYRSQATAFFWDYASADPTYVETLQGNYVNGGFTYKGAAGCFVQGRSSNPTTANQTKMLVYTGGVFQTLCTVDDAVPEHGGVEVVEDVVFFTAGGDVFQYGAPFVGLQGNFTAVAKGTGTTSGGMLKNFFANYLFLSSGTTSSGGLERIASGYATNATFQTPLVSIPFPGEVEGKIRMIKVYWGEVISSAGNNFSLDVNTDRSATNTTVISNLTTVTELVTKYYKATNNAALPNFESISFTGTYSSGSSTTNTPPYIQAIEVYFDFFNI